MEITKEEQFRLSVYLADNISSDNNFILASDVFDLLNKYMEKT